MLRRSALALSLLVVLLVLPWRDRGEVRAQEPGGGSEHEPVAPPPEPPRLPAEVAGSAKHAVPEQDGMLRLPEGTFMMGSDGVHAQPNERPVHGVRLGPLWIDRTEVTVGEVRACVASRTCPAPPGRAARGCTFATGAPDRPVSCVPWSYADAYCRSRGKRLPTEAEWEYAAHGSEHIRYPWGGAAPSCSLAATLRTNQSGLSCTPDGPAPVGSHPRGASPFGALDMAGNVEEWVADWYADRYDRAPLSEPAVAPRGPDWGNAKVLRGGGWMSAPRDVRASARSWGNPSEAGVTTGFRCARD